MTVKSSCARRKLLTQEEPGCTPEECIHVGEEEVLSPKNRQLIIDGHTNVYLCFFVTFLASF